MRHAVAIVAMFATAFGLAGCGGKNVALAGPTNINQGHTFTVMIDGQLSPDGWTAVKGLGFAVASVDGTDPSGVRTSSPDGPEPISVVFMAPMQGGALPDVQDWVKQVYQGNDIRKHITIELRDQAGTTVRTFNLFDCWPTHLELQNVDTGNPDVLHWTLEVRVNRIDMA